MSTQGGSGVVSGGGSSPSTSLFGNTALSASRALASSAFVAGDEPISIVPSFTYAAPIGLISGPVGPFRAGMDAVVPLWLAAMLRRRKLARIIPPAWMDADVLGAVLRFERDPNEASFSPDLPFRHAEIARAVLVACRAGNGSGAAAGDGGDSEIPNADRVKLLLEDIATVRMDKIRRNVHTLSAQTLSRATNQVPIIDVTNIGSLEMHAVKPFVTEAFRLHRELTGKGKLYSQSKEASGDGEDRLGGSGATASEAAASSSRRRLRVSRRPETDNTPQQEEANGGESGRVDEASGDGQSSGRSRLRRHR